jgi:hypothetical protein
MDYTIDHALNHAIREHPLLVSIIAGLANWGVVAFGVAACAIWLLDVPRRPGIWRRATAAGLSAAALGLLANQVIAQFWHRPRPYQDHPLGHRMIRRFRAITPPRRSRSPSGSSSSRGAPAGCSSHGRR